MISKALVHLGIMRAAWGLEAVSGNKAEAPPRCPKGKAIGKKKKLKTRALGEGGQRLLSIPPHLDATSRACLQPESFPQKTIQSKVYF